MGFLDRLLGREERPPAQTGPSTAQRGGYRTDYPAPGQPVSQTQHQGSGAQQPKTDDERAVERYRYLLKTAPPEQIEQAHAEAFEKLTPQQRQQVLSELSGQVPAAERAQTDSPRDLARMATRAEMRRPGTLERSFSGAGAGGGRGMGMGAVIGGSLLAGVAGAFVGTAIADAMFDGSGGDDYAQGFEDGAQADASDQGDPGADPGADAGYDDGGGFDGGFDGGGDLGGGDFGGFDV